MAKRSDKCTTQAYPFFKKHAGYVVGRQSEGVFHLAKAECAASKKGWRTDWDHDEDPDLSWASKKERESIKEVLCATLKDKQGKVLDSLCGIVDPDRNYGRVVEAELASQALHRKKKR